MGECVNLVAEVILYQMIIIILWILYIKTYIVAGMTGRCEGKTEKGFELATRPGFHH